MLFISRLSLGGDEQNQQIEKKVQKVIKRNSSTGHISTTHRQTDRQTQRNKAEAKWKMCCHLVSFSESCLARFFFFKCQANGNKCYSGLQRSQYCCTFRYKTGRNRQSANLSSSYNVTRSFLSNTFAVNMSDSSFSQGASPAHVRALLP